MRGQPLSVASFLRRARIAACAFTDIANWREILPLASRGEDVTEIRLRDGTVISAPPEAALWPHFSDVWYHSAYTKHCAIPAGAVVVDVGANVGVFSLFAARHAREVYALEPASSNFSRLVQNVRPARNVVPLQFACGAQDGEATLDLSGIPVTFSLKTSSSMKSELVKVIGLESLFSRYDIRQCDYLKLDCEGAEFDIVLDSAPSVFSRVHRIVMEYHDELSDRATHRNLSERLQSLGFKTTEYNPNGTHGMIAAIRPLVNGPA
jgi:FkbM family methyltransferase